MKKSFFPSVIAAAVVLISSQTAAQSTDISMVRNMDPKNGNTGSTNIKPEAISHSASYMGNNYARVVNTLNRRFPNASDIAYYETNDGFFVSFQQNGKSTHVCFSLQQQYKYAIIQVEAKDLPQTIKYEIEQHYPGYTLQDAYLVKPTSGLTWHRIILKNGNNYVEVSATEDGIKELQSLNAR